MEKPKTPPENSSENHPSANPELPNTVGRYMGTGFQIAGPVIAGFVIGYYIDKYLNNKTPIFTLLLSTLMIVVGLYRLVKEFMKK
ncbi:MAG: AtpZ/AtpI family protein [Bacteroidetes bacterium]|nr:AtpZ/AtpI family protein [Bacteroidota bacterium]